MDSPAWPLGSSPLPNLQRSHQNPVVGNAGVTISRRVHLARLLQDAHADQKHNTRALEESYHALRTSTRTLERRWATYCKELEHELDAPDWQGIGQGPQYIPERQRYHQPRDLDVARLDEAEVAISEYQLRRTMHDRTQTGYSRKDEYEWHPYTGEPVSSSSNRPRSNALQRPQPHDLASPPRNDDAKRPRLPTYDFASRSLEPQNPPSRQSAESRASSPTVPKLPARKASLPTREQLVALSEQARQRLVSAHFGALPIATPIINIVPPTPPESRQGIPGLQQRPRSVRAVDATSSVPQSPQSDSPTRPRLVGVNDHHDLSLRSSPVNSTEGQEVQVTHEKLRYQPGVDGHWMPRNIMTAPGGRARLRKRMKGEAGEQRRG